MSNGKEQLGPKAGYVATVNLPSDLAERLELWAGRHDRSKSWIIRQAVADWLAEEDRRYELTLVALKDVDEGRTHTQEEVEARAADRKAARRAKAQKP